MKLLSQSSARYDMTDVMLCLALSLRIHGTEQALRATAHRMRPQVRREIQPILGRIIRIESPIKFVQMYLDVRG